MRISIRHEMSFALEPDTIHAVQHLLVTPRETPAQETREWSVAMPGIETAARFTDAFGNMAVLCSQTRPEAETLFIAISGVVETKDTHGVLGRLDADPLPALFKRFTPDTRPNGHLVNRLKAQQRAGTGRVELLHWLMNRLHEATDCTEDEDESDSPDIVAEDHAHVFVAAARGMDIPARFVTGYVLPEDGESAHLHFWAEAFDPDLGWIGFDPAANLCPTDAYVRLAAGLDADSARPFRCVPQIARTDNDSVIVRQMMANQQQ